MRPFETISVIGLGYIGLPTAAIIASCGRKVIGVDVNAQAVATINRGEIHIIEPDLDVLVRKVVADGYLSATTEVQPADAFLIAVPTPFKAGNQPDLSFIEAAVSAIAPVLAPGNVVILESTSPTGATEQLCEWLSGLRPDLRFPRLGSDQADIAVAYCPERVLPGDVLNELVRNDRVIGGITPACSQAAKALYQIFVKGQCIVTNARTAEMCKLTENSFRDVNIAFANELSVICDKQGIDVWELIALANRHPRVNILRPGPGVGGHCIAVDPWFIVSSSPDEARIIRTAREINDHKPHWVIEKVGQTLDRLAAGKSRDGLTIGCLGLAFKPDIDDLRESPAVEIVKTLAVQHPGPVLVAEPNVPHLPAALAGKGNVRLVDVPQAMKADLLVALVAHSEFKATDAPDPATTLDVAGIWVR